MCIYYHDGVLVYYYRNAYNRRRRRYCDNQSSLLQYYNVVCDNLLNRYPPADRSIIVCVYTRTII